VAKIRLTLQPGDWNGAVRGEADKCLLAQALTRKYGGDWTVTGFRARSRGRTLRLGWDARHVMHLFDHKLDRKKRKTVTFYGKVPRRRAISYRDRREGWNEPCISSPGKQSRIPARYKTRAAAGGAAVAGSAVMVADGSGWLLGVIAALAALGIGAVVASGKSQAGADQVRVRNRGTAQPAYAPQPARAPAPARQDAPATWPEPAPAQPERASARVPDPEPVLRPWEPAPESWPAGPGYQPEQVRG
jgi:hypothetical protein